jgi:CarboxypepD_reg-like domain
VGQKWKGSLAIALLTITQPVAAQNFVFTGSVKDEQGLPIASASVLLQGTSTGTVTDSLGLFTLKIAPGVALVISAVGYQADTIQTGVGNRVMVELKKGAATTLSNVVVPATQTSPRPPNPNDPSGTVAGVAIGYTLDDYSHASSSSFSRATHSSDMSSLPEFMPKEDTKGSRYFFPKWVGGVVVDSGNNIIVNKSYLFNYDKITRSLLLTTDLKTALEIDKESVKAFDLKDEDGKEYLFELVPGVGNGNFVLRLAGQKQYRLYKYTTTKFVKSNYRSDGLTESGNNYDEYVDESSYFLVDGKTRAVKKVELKKKSIKEAYAAEAEKTQKYFSDHSDQDINEEFVIGLTNQLNN